MTIQIIHLQPKPEVVAKINAGQFPGASLNTRGELVPAPNVNVPVNVVLTVFETLDKHNPGEYRIHVRPDELKPGHIVTTAAFGELHVGRVLYTKGSLVVADWKKGDDHGRNVPVFQAGVERLLVDLKF